MMIGAAMSIRSSFFMSMPSDIDHFRPTQPSCARANCCARRQLTAAKPSEARTAGSIMDGVHGGSNVIVTSTDRTPDTCIAAFAAPSLRKPAAGQPLVVAVITTQASPFVTAIP